MSIYKKDIQEQIKKGKKRIKFSMKRIDDKIIILTKQLSEVVEEKELRLIALDTIRKDKFKKL